VYDKLGFVNQEGLLQVFVNSTLDTIPETCPKTEIIDIPDTLWGEFTIGDQIPQEGECNMSASKRSTSESNLRDNLEKLNQQSPSSSSSSESTSTTNMDIKTKDMIDNLQEMNKQVEETRDQMERMNAVQEVMETFRSFFKWRYLFFFIGIILLFAFVYSFFSTSKGKQPMIDPGKAQEMTQSMAASAMAAASTAAAMATVNNSQEQPQLESTDDVEATEIIEAKTDDDDDRPSSLQENTRDD
jgi:hypothetical protein